MKTKQADLKLGKALFRGEDWDALYVWLKNAFKNDFNYSVFLGRSSYVVALLLDGLCGNKFFDTSSVKVLTDSAFLCKADEISEYYKQNRRFPKIVISDNLILHGRNCNSILHNMEKRIVAAVKDRIPAKSDLEISREWVRSVHLNLFACSNKDLLLTPKYTLRLTCQRFLGLNDIHELSGAFSTFVSYGWIANTAYMYSALVKENTEDAIGWKLEEKRAVTTRYWDCVENAWIVPLQAGIELKAILTVRQRESRICKHRMLIPFVFLPELGEADTSLIFDYVFSGQTGEVREWKRYLWDNPDHRQINEAISLYLGHVLLAESVRQFGLDEKILQTGRAAELSKLARNYYYRSQEDTERLLDCFLIHAEKRKWEGFCNMLSSLQASFFTGQSAKTHVTLNMSRKQALEKLEDYFYGWALENEFNACKQQDSCPLESVSSFLERFVPLELPSKLIMGNNYEKRLQTCMSYFFQMVDAGIASVTHAGAVRQGKHDHKGFASYVNVGKQSMLIRVLRAYEFIPALAELHHQCESNQWDYNTYVNKYLEYRFGNDKGNEELKRYVFSFLKGVASCDQVPEDWNGGYVRKLWFDNADNPKALHGDVDEPNYSSRKEYVELELQEKRFMRWFLSNGMSVLHHSSPPEILKKRIHQSSLSYRI